METERYMKASDFMSSVIAQDDDNDYSESGWIACVFPDGTAAVGSYSHCSCYGTFEALCGGGIGDDFEEGTASFVWSGSVDELVDMARRTADPVFPDRRASSEDYDYDHLTEMYKQVLAWKEKGPAE